MLENDEDGFQGYERLSPVSGVEDCGPFKKVLRLFLILGRTCFPLK